MIEEEDEAVNLLPERFVEQVVEQRRERWLSGEEREPGEKLVVIDG